MQNAVFLASIFGPFLLILGLWMLLYHDNMMKVVSSTKSTPSVLGLVGIINLLIGLTVLGLYHTWSWSFPVLVTALGWFYLLRGLMIFFVPQVFVKFVLSNTSWLKIRGILPVVWGLALCWLAFWMK